MSGEGRGDGAQLAAGIAMVSSGVVALCVVVAMALLGYSTITRLLVAVAAGITSPGLWYLAARSRWRGKVSVAAVSLLHAAVLLGVPTLGFVLSPGWLRGSGPGATYGSLPYAIWSGTLYGSFWAVWALVLRRRSRGNGSR